MNILSKYKLFFNTKSANRRSNKAIKNILWSIFFKGSSILISLVLVPLTLSYLNTYEYGVWLTISSILTWIYFFDIGLGNGLRNKLTEALAKRENELAKIYISTTFFYMGIIAAGFYILFMIAQYWLNWNAILNVDSNKVSNINSIVAIVFAFFCLNFVFRLIGNIYMAYQKPAINDLLSFIGNVISLVLIYICTIFSSGSLLYVASIFSGIPVIILIIAYPITFHYYKNITPSLRYVRPRYLNSLMALGLQFFIIQVSCIVIFMTSNLIISHLFSPEEVTPYNIAFKYFTLIITIFTIIITPFWSAITEAYTLNDMKWIKQSIPKLIIIWGILSIITLIMVIISPWAYRIWIGDEVKVPFSLSIFCGLYATITNWNNIYSYTLNGVGKIKLQLYSSIISGLLYIPLAIVLGRLIGISGVMLATCFILLISSIWSPIQCWKIINYKAKGIWNK